jgi:uncharacterized protein (DUF488 family)
MMSEGSQAQELTIWSIGHSTLSYEVFSKLLNHIEITAIADVRSSPYSRNFPHFNRENLVKELAAENIAYVFLGRELGGRPGDPALFTDGVADYEKMARAPLFVEGLERVRRGAEKYNIALMCSERSPFDCHRCLLVGRALKERGFVVRHALPDGRQLTQRDVEDRLLEMGDKAGEDFFSTHSDRLNDAYRSRASRVAYTQSSESRGAKVGAEGN